MTAHDGEKHSEQEQTRAKAGNSRWTAEAIRALGAITDLQTLADCFSFMDGKCICALADGASWAARAFLTQFRADFEAHVAQHKCPFPESFEV